MILFYLRVSEKFLKISINKIDITPLFCVSPAGSTYQSGLKHSSIRLQTLQDKDEILLFENKFTGGISSVMGDRYVKSVEKKYYICKLLICMVRLKVSLCPMMKFNLI